MEAKKYADPTDPDPQHCAKGSCYLGESDGAVLPLEEIQQLYIHPLHAAQLPNNPVSCEVKQYTGDPKAIQIRHKDRLRIIIIILHPSKTAVLIMTRY